MLKCNNIFFDVVACERLCIPFDGNEMAEVEEPFLDFFQLLHLNNGVWTNET